MKIFLDMVGCRLNQSEIERMALDFLARGEEVVSNPSEADLIVVNTCCVTAKACADSRKTIRHYQRETNAEVVATGCYVSAFEGQAFELVGESRLFPNESKDALPSLITGINLPRDSFVVSGKPELGPRSRTRGFLKVQDGCNNYCTYCLTRVARGKSRSIPADEVIQQAQQAETSGIKEIVLTGVQIGSWGKDFAGEARIADLVNALLRRTSIPRVRISSIEPWDIDDALLDCFSNPRLCPHLHIPLQSGSEAVLQRMARPFSAESFRSLMLKIQEKLPGLMISTDLITGFPGETEALFEETRAFVQEMDFSGGHVFKFSPMAGTAAARMDERVPERVSHARSQELRRILQEKTRRKQTAKIGATVEVLWEHGRENRYSGFTRDYFRIQTTSSLNLSNMIGTARVTGLTRGGILLADAPQAPEPDEND